MKTPARVGIAVLGLAVLGCAFTLGLMVRHGISARQDPMAIEVLIARQLRHLAVPGAARDQRNPVLLTREVLSEARAHFADHCAQCHGNDGSGQTQIGRSMYPRAPDMRAAQTQSLSDGELFYIIKNGVRLTGMPAWGEDTPEDDRQSWHLVHLIRHLPQITQQELEEMQGMNPRSPEEIEEERQEELFLEGKETPQTQPSHHH